MNQRDFILVIEQLENNEQVMLMYLADELPTADRAEVERMLALDPSLAAQLESLRAADAQLREGLAALDDSEQSRASEAAAVRRTVRAMRKRLLDPRDARPAANPRLTLRYPWWAYPTAAAATILLRPGKLENAPLFVQFAWAGRGAGLRVHPCRRGATRDRVGLPSICRHGYEWLGAIDLAQLVSRLLQLTLVTLPRS